jgi:hypothetical protein
VKENVLVWLCNQRNAGDNSLEATVATATVYGSSIDCLPRTPYHHPASPLFGLAFILSLTATHSQRSSARLHFTSLSRSLANLISLSSSSPTVVLSPLLPRHSLSLLENIFRLNRPSFLLHCRPRINIVVVIASFFQSSWSVKAQAVGNVSRIRV